MIACSGVFEDSQEFAMGQTYKQLNGGEMGRLNMRGEENAEGVAPTPYSSSLWKERSTTHQAGLLTFLFQ